MRHWLCVLLLTLLPLQFSWGAVAGYCTHESSAQAKHLGHHQHEHGKTPDASSVGTADDADAPSKGDDSRASATVDPDCGHCHGLGVGVPMPHVPLHGPLTARGDAPGSVGALTLRTASPPDRPQWLPLA